MGLVCLVLTVDLTVRGRNYMISICWEKEEEEEEEEEVAPNGW